MGLNFEQISNGPTSNHFLPALLYITNVRDMNGIKIIEVFFLILWTATKDT